MRDPAGQGADGFESLGLEKLTLHHSLLRDILGHAHDAADDSRRLPHREGPVVDPAQRTIGADHPVGLVVGAQNLPRCCRGRDPAAILLMDAFHPRERVRIKARAGAAPDFFVAGTDVEDTLLHHIRHPKDLAYVFRDLAKPLLAGAQRDLRPPLVLDQAEQGPPGFFRHGEQAAGLLLPGGQLPGVPAQLQLRHHAAAQRAQRRALLGGQAPGHPIHHAERAEGLAIGGDQRRTGVEAHLRAGHHEFAAGEARVRRGIRHFQQDVGVQDRLRAKRAVTRGLGGIHPDSRLEPLTPFVHQRDHRGRHLADVRGQHGQVVESFLGRRIEHLVGAQGFEPFSLVGRQRSAHGASPMA